MPTPFLPRIPPAKPDLTTETRSHRLKKKSPRLCASVVKKSLTNLYFPFMLLLFAMKAATFS